MKSHKNIFTDALQSTRLEKFRNISKYDRHRVLSEIKLYAVGPGLYLSKQASVAGVFPCVF